MQGTLTSRFAFKVVLFSCVHFWIGSQLEVRYGEMALLSHIFNDRQRCWSEETRWETDAIFQWLLPPDIPRISNTVLQRFVELQVQRGRACEARVRVE